VRLFEFTVAQFAFTVSMSEAIRSPLSENEIEFLAEDELITITPAFHCGKVACMMARLAPCAFPASNSLRPPSHHFLAASIFLRPG
jgi:hypothetical protein